MLAEGALTQPVWIDCRSVADVGSPEQLAVQARGGHHVVLRFPLLSHDEKTELIGHLRAALPEYSIFDSGVGLSPALVTIIPVVARKRVLERRAEVLRAIEDYRLACVALVEQYRWSLPVHEPTD
jgi:hypothetical protein